MGVIYGRAIQTEGDSYKVPYLGEVGAIVEIKGKESETGVIVEVGRSTVTPEFFLGRTVAITDLADKLEFCDDGETT